MYYMFSLSLFPFFMVDIRLQLLNCTGMNRHMLTGYILRSLISLSNTVTGVAHSPATPVCVLHLLTVHFWPPCQGTHSVSEETGSGLS